MMRSSPLQFLRVLQIAAAVCLVLLPLPVSAHEHDIKTPEPGFRPESEHASAFLEALDTTTIAVHPSIIRRADRTAHSFASQEQIIALLGERNIAAAVKGNRRIDFGVLPWVPQWDLFQNDLWQIGEKLRARPSDAEYDLFMEFLFPVSDQEIFGIECYILDNNGENAFSFLLNSHHQLFVDARLFADKSSQAARTELLQKATLLGMTALQQQIEASRKGPVGKIADEGPTGETDPGQ